MSMNPDDGKYSPEQEHTMDHHRTTQQQTQNAPKPTTILGREPVLYLALVQTALALGVGFGLELTPEQIGLVMATTAAVLGFVARQTVTPAEKA